MNKHSQNCQSYFTVPMLYLGIFQFCSFFLGGNGVDSMVKHKRIASATDYLPFIFGLSFRRKGVSRLYCTASYMVDIFVFCYYSLRTVSDFFCLHVYGYDDGL